MPDGQQPRGVTPRPRSWAAAESARLRRRRNSQEELPHVRGQGRRPRGATLRPRSVGRWEELSPAPTPEARDGGGRTNPMSKERWLRGRRRA